MQHAVDLLSPPITLLLLVAVGLDLTVSDFRSVRERPGMVALGVLLPAVLLPPLAVALIELVQPSPVIAAGLLLLVVCPIGGVSNFYSALAGASTALSVTLTAASCAAAVATIPLATAWLEILLGHPTRYSAPLGTLVAQVLVGLLPPVAIGMAARHAWPRLGARYLGAIQAAGFALLGLLLALLWASAASASEIAWWSAAQVVTAFVVAAFVIGAGIGWAGGGRQPDRFTLAAEFATRNMAVALALATALGAQREFLWFGAVYFAIEIPLLVMAALAYRRLGREASGRGAERDGGRGALSQPWGA